MKLILFALITTLCFSNTFANPGDIKVKVKNLRNKKGNILLSVYNKEDQFPRKPFKIITIKKSNVKNGILETEVKDLPKGEYAFSLLDDENSNDDMDYSWIGTPIEGYSFSNDAKPKLLSAPDYEDAVFYLGDKTKMVELNVTYW